MVLTSRGGGSSGLYGEAPPGMGAFLISQQTKECCEYTLGFKSRILVKVRSGGPRYIAEYELEKECCYVKVFLKVVISAEEVRELSKRQGRKSAGGGKRRRGIPKLGARWRES